MLDTLFEVMFKFEVTPYITFFSTDDPLIFWWRKAILLVLELLYYILNLNAKLFYKILQNC